MHERLKLNPIAFAKLERFVICDRAAAIGDSLLNEGREVFDLMDSNGKILLKDADSEIINAIDHGADELFHDLTHPIRIVNGEAVRNPDRTFDRSHVNKKIHRKLREIIKSNWKDD